MSIPTTLFAAYQSVVERGLAPCAETFCNSIGKAIDGTLETVLPEKYGALETALLRIAGVKQAEVKFLAQAFAHPQKGKTAASPTETEKWEAMRREVMEAFGSPVVDHPRDYDVTAIYNRWNSTGRKAS